MPNRGEYASLLCMVLLPNLYAVCSHSRCCAVELALTELASQASVPFCFLNSGFLTEAPLRPVSGVERRVRPGAGARKKPLCRWGALTAAAARRAITALRKARAGVALAAAAARRATTAQPAPVPPSPTPPLLPAAAAAPPPRAHCSPPAPAPPAPSSPETACAPAASRAACSAPAAQERQRHWHALAAHV